MHHSRNIVVSGSTTRHPTFVMRSQTHKYGFGAVIPFLLIHMGALLAIVTPASWWMLSMSYAVRMFGVTGGYHRYFSHRSYKLGRAAQFVLAVVAQSSGQKGVLWWAAL